MRGSSSVFERVGGNELLEAGTRVEVCYTALEPKDRAPSSPVDTRRLPYQVRVKGVLEVASRLSDPDVRIRTASGRTASGRIVQVEPGDFHTFGRPAPALVAATEQIARLGREDL